MQLFQLFQWIFYLLLFFVAITVCIYSPGFFVVKKLKVHSSFEKIVLANAIGIALWGMQGYIFGSMHIRFMAYLYSFFAFLFLLGTLDEHKKVVHEVIRACNKKNLFFILLIGLGCAVQLMSVFGSGIYFSDGIRFFGNNAYDGVMHLSYASSIMRDFPPKEPAAFGMLIKNYHYWTDLVIADFSRIWHIPISNLFFQFFPLYLSIFIGLTAYVLVRVWNGTRVMALWFLFLLYFAADAAYIVILIIHKSIGFYTPAIDSATLQFLNMPHVFGKFLFLSSLIIMNRWSKNSSQIWGLVMAVMFGVLFGFKVYFGIFAGIGFLAYLLGAIFFESRAKKRITIQIQYITTFLLFCIVAGAIFLPHNRGAGGFVFVYLEWPRSLLGVGSIDWNGWWLRRQVYEQANNMRNIVFFDLLAIMIAYMSIYGTRLLGFFITPRLARFVGIKFMLFFLVPLIIFQLLGLFTIQVSGGVNVFNFFSVSSIILSFFAAYTLSSLPKTLFWKVFLVIFILLTIPRTLHETFFNITKYNSTDYRVISYEELEAMNYIKHNAKKSDFVQSHPNNELDWQSPYVSFFTNRFGYLSGVGLLTTHNVETKREQAELRKIFMSNDIIEFVLGMKKKNISYLYLRKVPEEKLLFNLTADGTLIKKVFENSGTVVLRID